jgi:hypothetical protein
MEMRESDTRQDAMKDCRERAYREFDVELSVVKQLVKLYSDVLERAMRISFHSLNFLQRPNLGLAVRSYRSLNYAIDALENGSYEVAIILLHSVFENRNMMMYFVKFPDKAEEWLMKHKKIEQRKIRDKLRLVEAKETYEALSDLYFHPNTWHSLLPMILDEKSAYHHYPYFRMDECRLSVGCWISFTKDTITLLLNVFQPQQLGDVSWKRTVAQVLKTANECAIEIDHDSRKYEEIH